MAVECALENSIATLIGPLFVANLANAFGYEFGRNEDCRRPCFAFRSLARDHINSPKAKFH